MHPKFLKAIKDKDLFTIRMSLADELLFDPRGNSFNEMLEYAKKNIPDLFDIDDCVIYSKNRDSWDKEFLFKLKNDLDYNFSEEKLSFYEKVAKEVLKSKAETLENIESNEHSPNGNNIYKGIVIGGALTTIAGLCTTKILLTSLGIAGMVAGGILLHKENQKK